MIVKFSYYQLSGHDPQKKDPAEMTKKKHE